MTCGRARAGGADGLDLALVDLLDRLVEQLADEADGAQRDGDDAGQHAGTEDRSPAAAPQISALIERDDDDDAAARAAARAATLGVVLRAARNASGVASTIASRVPSVAMLIVSHSGRHSRSA